MNNIILDFFILYSCGVDACYFKDPLSYVGGYDYFPEHIPHYPPDWVEILKEYLHE